MRVCCSSFHHRISNLILRCPLPPEVTVGSAWIHLRIHSFWEGFLLLAVRTVFPGVNPGICRLPRNMKDITRRQIFSPHAPMVCFGGMGVGETTSPGRTYGNPPSPFLHCILMKKVECLSSRAHDCHIPGFSRVRFTSSGNLGKEVSFMRAKLQAG